MSIKEKIPNLIMSPEKTSCFIKRQDSYLLFFSLNKNTAYIIFFFLCYFLFLLSIYLLFFKQYILGIMFYRYISENITNYVNEGERKAGDAFFDYAKLKDSDAKSEKNNLVKEKGFFKVPTIY